MRSKKLIFVFSFILFLAFIFFSYLVAKERFTTFDFDTTVKFQDRIPRKLDLLFSIFSLIGSAEITSIFWLALVLIAIVRRYWITLVTLSSFFVALAIEVFGKLFVQHPSPPYLFYRGIFEYNFPSHYVQTDYSYPSGHMTRTAFLVAFLLVFFQLKSPWKIRFLPQVSLLLFLTVMAVSRIYLGEHWTSDVIGGFLLGSSFGAFTAATVPLRNRIKKVGNLDN